MVQLDGVGDLLQDHRLARARRGDEQPPLAEADGRQHVDDAQRDVLAAAGEVDLALRVDDGQLVPLGRLVIEVRCHAADGRRHDELRILSASLRRPHLPVHDHAIAHAVLPDKSGRHRGIVGRGLVGALRAAQEAVPFARHVQHAHVVERSDLRGLEGLVGVRRRRRRRLKMHPVGQPGLVERRRPAGIGGADGAASVGRASAPTTAPATSTTSCRHALFSRNEGPAAGRWSIGSGVGCGCPGTMRSKRLRLTGGPHPDSRVGDPTGSQGSEPMRRALLPETGWFPGGKPC